MNEVPCPRCHYLLIPEAYLCTHCFWVMPSPMRLLSLLDLARNHVQDAELRAEITRIVPPKPRDWPEWMPRFGVHNG